jgi:hypothetical protein
LIFAIDSNTAVETVERAKTAAEATPKKLQAAARPPSAEDAEQDKAAAAQAAAQAAEHMKAAAARAAAEALERAQAAAGATERVKVEREMICRQTQRLKDVLETGEGQRLRRLLPMRPSGRRPLS